MQSSRRSQTLFASLRRLARPSLAVVAISALVVVALNAFLSRQLQQMLIEQTETASARLITYLEDKTPPGLTPVQTLVAQTRIMKDLKQDSFPWVLSNFAVYDRNGRMFANGGADLLSFLPDGEIHDPAVDTLIARRPVSSIELVTGSDGEKNWLGDTYRLLRAPDGQTIGVLETFFDHTSSYAGFRTGIALIRDSVSILAVAIYLVPSLLLVLQSERRREREQTIARLTDHDPLTGLRNRVSFQAHLVDAARKEGPSAGVLLVDIDDFRSRNASLGTEHGDACLRHLARSLESMTRDTDIVARLGGDQFAILVPTASNTTLEALSQRLLRACRRIRMDEVACDGLTVSVGAYLLHDGDNAGLAMDAVERAMTHAKVSGGDRLVLYDDNLDARIRRRRIVERRLREAIATDGIEVAYQPIVHASQHHVLGYEALARLSDRDGTPISPAEFIPIAEAQGLISEVSDCVLSRALTEMRRWPSDVFLAINLSPLQFENETLAKSIATRVRDANLPPARIELEITESVLIDDAGHVARQLDQLRDAGFRLALDDFGSGYSGFGYLSKYVFHKVKIDRMFASDAADTHAAILETMVHLSRRLNLVVCVEGIETAATLDRLRTLAIDQFQGFYFGRPGPVKEIDSGEVLRLPTAS